MSSFDYSKSAETAKRLIEKFGTTGDLQITTHSIDDDEPWKNPAANVQIFKDMPCVMLDYVRRYDKKGQLVVAQNTIYVDVEKLNGLANIPVNSVFTCDGRKLAVRDSELLRPAGVNVLLTLWVSAYG